MRDETFDCKYLIHCEAGVFQQRIVFGDGGLESFHDSLRDELECAQHVLFD
jgi:hypothetical protein